MEELPDLEMEDIKAALNFAARRLDHPVMVARSSGSTLNYPQPWNPGLAVSFLFKLLPRDLGLRNAKDHEIFLAARKANALVMTKDPVLL